jgi:hypothetical protein
MTPHYPRELAALPQWVCWRLEPDPKGGKDTKIPYNPKTGKKASSTNPQTWSTLRDALAAAEKYLYTGIGFVFTREGGIVGIDIDHCRDAETGALNDTAKAIVERVSTYTEISPSGTGLHLFLKGEMPGGGNKNSRTGVEMYAHSRFFTMTGQRLPDTPEEVAADANALAWVHENYVKPPRKERSKKKSRSGKKGAPLSDEEVLEKARSAGNHEDFTALWEGRWEEKYGSQSEADMALCCTLAFWTARNKEQIDRLFRQSSLMRDKWDKVHHASGATYGEETLDKAIEATESVYNPENDAPIFEYEGRYFRAKGDNVYPITNFVMQPVEMIVSDDETQITADLVTVRGEVFQQTFMTTDFSNLQRFKNILNKRTISLSYTGSEGDLELLKGYISELEWTRRVGVRALGVHDYAGRWVFVSPEGALEAGGSTVPDIMQLEKWRSISTDIVRFEPISAKGLQDLGGLLLGYNEPAKTVAVLAWCAGCFIKEHLKRAKVKFPHLFLIGEAGSGKSNTLERVILPVFGREKVSAATQVTSFTLMKDSASSNVIPQPLDEFKPSKIDRMKLHWLYNHMRDSYDGHEGVRGRADQSVITYELLAPLIVAGEESPDEAAIRERGIELLFSRKDLKSADYRKAFLRLCEMPDALGGFGRGLLDMALRTKAKETVAWHTAAKELFGEELPSRIVNNLACCMAGLRLVERLCAYRKLEWSQVFDIDLDACARHLNYAAREYLLDGSTINKSVVEHSLEVMDRMGLDSQSEVRILDDGALIAFRFQKFYDRYTKYRRDHAIGGECLSFEQFKKQLRNSDLYVDYKNVRFESGTAKATVLNYALLRQRCEITGFTGIDALPLNEEHN